VDVTDDDRYRFIAARREVADVTFAQPSGGSEFRVLARVDPSTA